PRPWAPTTRSTTTPRTSRGACASSPTAAASTSSTTAWGGPRSRARSTACGRAASSSPTATPRAPCRSRASWCWPRRARSTSLAPRRPPTWPRPSSSAPRPPRSSTRWRRASCRCRSTSATRSPTRPRPTGRSRPAGPPAPRSCSPRPPCAAPMREILESAFRRALEGASPRELTLRGLPEERPALVLAVGKAALSMLDAARSRFPGVPWLATPPAAGGAGARSAPPGGDGTAGGAAGEVLPGTHPLPDERSVLAANRALEAARRLEAGDLLLLLVSGGGSALWCAPSCLDLDAKRRLTVHLQRAGADIGELNTVRRHLSLIKGGGLLAATKARVLSLLLSDVPGDAPWDVASRPGVADPTPFEDALEVLRRYPGEPTAAAAECFRRGARGELPETVKPGSAVDARSDARVVGTSRTLLTEAAGYLERHLGVQVIELHHDLGGEASELARRHARLAASVLAGEDARPILPLVAADPPYVAWRLRRLERSRPVALISAGE